MYFLNPSYHQSFQIHNMVRVLSVHEYPQEFDYSPELWQQYVAMPVPSHSECDIVQFSYRQHGDSDSADGLPDSSQSLILN